METLFVVVCVLLACGLIWFCFSSLQRNDPSAGASEIVTWAETPEWRALVAIRDEIESDPLLDDESRQVHLNNWKKMAGEVRSQNGSLDLPEGRGFNKFTNRVNPYWGVVAVLCVSTVLLVTIGGFHEGSFRFAKAATGGAPTADQALSRQAGHPGDGGSLEERVLSLETKLKQDPSDPNGWVLLARTQAALSRYADSARSLEQALILVPDHPHLLADLADMLAMANDRQLSGRPAEIIQRVLAIDPVNEKGLALAATAAQQAGNEAEAQRYWSTLADIQKQAVSGSQKSSSASSNAQQQAQRQPSSMIRASISVPNEWADPTGNSVLFLFVKASPEAGRPLAAVRRPIGDDRQFNLEISAENFIGGMPDMLPSSLFVQAKIAVSGSVTSDDRDLITPWKEVASSDLPVQLDIRFENK